MKEDTYSDPLLWLNPCGSDRAMLTTNNRVIFCKVGARFDQIFTESPSFTIEELSKIVTEAERQINAKGL